MLLVRQECVNIMVLLCDYIVLCSYVIIL